MDYSELVNIASLLVRLLYVKKYSDPSIQHCKEVELFRREGQAWNETGDFVRSEVISFPWWRTLHGFICSEVFAWECKPIGAGRILIVSLKNGFMFLYSSDTLSERCLVMLSHACGSTQCVAGLQQNLATRRKSASYFPWRRSWSAWLAQAAVFSTCTIVERLVRRSSDANLPMSCSTHKLHEAVTIFVDKGTKNWAEAK